MMKDCLPRDRVQHNRTAARPSDQRETRKPSAGQSRLCVSVLEVTATHTTSNRTST